MGTTSPLQFVKKLALKKKIYAFIYFGWAGSSFLHAGFL